MLGGRGTDFMGMLVWPPGTRFDYYGEPQLSTFFLMRVASFVQTQNTKKKKKRKKKEGKADTASLSKWDFEGWEA